MTNIKKIQTRHEYTNYQICIYLKNKLKIPKVMRTAYIGVFLECLMFGTSSFMLIFFIFECSISRLHEFYSVMLVKKTLEGYNIPIAEVNIYSWLILLTERPHLIKFFQICLLLTLLSMSLSNFHVVASNRCLKSL